MKLEEGSSELNIDIWMSECMGDPDPQVAEYLRTPGNERLNSRMKMKDVDGEKLYLIASDPYGNYHHIIRKDGSYSKRFPGRLTGWIWEKEIDGKLYLCSKPSLQHKEHYIDVETGEVKTPSSMGILEALKETLLEIPEVIRKTIDPDEFYGKK